MTSGQWNNQDGLVLQFGTAKALPDWGGDYLAYGSTRELEALIPLVPTTMGGYTMPAIPTTFSGTTTYAAAGISNPDLLFPLQTFTVDVASGSAITITKPQIFVESVSLSPIEPVTGGTSISVGLATLNPTNQQYVQITPNAGTQLVSAAVTATLNNGTSTFWSGTTNTYAVPTATAGGGSWVGIPEPLVTNAITPLPQQAWISAIATGAFTAGLVKMRVRYFIWGTTNQ